MLVGLLALDRGLTAAELSIFAGDVTANSIRDEVADAWSIEYRDAIADTLAGGFVYLNEGHPAKLPKRDGMAGELWLDDIVGEQLNLALGTGPYFYAATVRRRATITASAGSSVPARDGLSGAAC